MPLRDRLLEAVGNATGLTVRDSEYVERLEESSARFGAFADETEVVLEDVLDYVGTRQPYESQPMARRFLTGQARRAFVRDPNAGAEANLRSNFAFGRGVSKPEAADEEVQRIIDRAWDDPSNRRKLTSFDALRKRSNDLLTGANLFPTVFVRNGRVKVAFHNEDHVTDVVLHPDDDETPLWYVVRKAKTRWDFDLHAADYRTPEMGKSGLERVYYLQHWRNVDDAERDAAEQGKAPPERPRAEDIIDGARVEHVRINRVGRTEWGIPPWARTLRFYSALNQLTEAQVQMRQAAATIVAKRTRNTGPRGLFKEVSSLRSRLGEMGSSRRAGIGGGPDPAGPGTDPRRGAPPPPAGSHWLENESDKLEAVRLSSGAGEATQDAQIVRAPIAAASQFGQHYFGDASNATLASATALELPGIMEILAWQEPAEGMLRWFVDRAIEAALHAGQLGGVISEAETDDDRPLGDLRLPEDRDELEKRTGRDLSYTFEMPYPGRRALPDVLQFVEAVATVFDPEGNNPWLRRRLMTFAWSEGVGVDDARRITDEVMPESPEPPALDPDTPPPAPDEPMEPPAGGGAAPRPRVSRDTRETGERSVNGEKRRSPQPTGPMAESDLAELVAAMNDDVRAEFEALLADPRALLGGHGAAAAPPSGR